MSKILIQLNCSLNIKGTTLQKKGFVENNDRRLKQIIDGVKKFTEKKYGVDIIFVDNTIPENIPIDKELETLLINNNIEIFHDNKNIYGSSNKGAGVIESWLFIKEKLENYDYLLYFEPRLMLLNFDFINIFLESPRNLFVYGNGKNHFFTGLFGIKSELLLKYIDGFKHLKHFRKLGSIEYHIFNFVKNNDSYDTLEKANVIWSDTVAKKDYNF
tara:strand:+ start:367 stop:1011 length:645 start_codon:yes stop_codon:yes gene_type:complete